MASVAWFMGRGSSERTSRATYTVPGFCVQVSPERRALYRQVVSGRITMTEARRKAGMKVLTYMERAQKAVRMLSAEDRAAFMAWLRKEGEGINGKTLR
jgi:hypothetical protein